jgi:hypothetical protein
VSFLLNQNFNLSGGGICNSQHISILKLYRSSQIIRYALMGFATTVVYGIIVF